MTERFNTHLTARWQTAHTSVPTFLADDIDSFLDVAHMGSRLGTDWRGFDVYPLADGDGCADEVASFNVKMLRSENDRARHEAALRMPDLYESNNEYSHDYWLKALGRLRKRYDIEYQQFRDELLDEIAGAS